MHLALLRGTAWEPKHWQRVLTLVGLPSKKRDNLTLKDLLGVSNAIASNAEAIRELDAQAQSEGIIRKALEELETWGYQRKFALTQSTDSSGREVSLFISPCPIAQFLPQVLVCCDVVHMYSCSHSFMMQQSMVVLQVKLVKEWREAITEVSDQQSLVASLQQSMHYSHFRDQIDSWASRLSILQVCK
jgi:dynein heavy chain 2, cytosolic